MCLIGDRKQDWLYFLTKSKGDQEIGNDKAKIGIGFGKTVSKKRLHICYCIHYTVANV